MLREWGFDACVAYMHDLAWEAAAMLTARWGTRFEIPRHMVGTMVTVPLPGEAGATEADATRCARAARRGSYRGAAVRLERPAVGGSSAQIYNDRADIDRLAEAVARRL